MCKKITHLRKIEVCIETIGLRGGNRTVAGEEVMKKVMEVSEHATEKKCKREVTKGLRG